MRKIFTFLLVSLLHFYAFAGAGIFEYYLDTNLANYGNYSKGNAFSGTIASNLDLNSSTLFIDLSGVKTFQDNGDNVSSAAINYRVYKSTATPGGFSSQLLPQYGSQVVNNKEWQNNANIDLVQGITEVGTYIVEVYFTAEGNFNGGTFQLNFPSAGTLLSASFSVSAILPVVFSSIKVEKLDNKNIIKWQTHSEHNHSHYEIQRSIDGLDWISIGRADGLENRTALKNYQYIDIHPEIGINYYRIKQVDIDGTTSYSKTVSALYQDLASEDVLFSNPIIGNTLELQINNESVDRILVIDQLGRKLIDKAMKADDLNSKISLPFENHPKGIYILAIQDKNGKIISRKNILKL